MTPLQQQITNLRNLGYSYNKIRTELKCSKGTIAYYLGHGQKTKTLLRTQKCRNSKHPYESKIAAFVQPYLTTLKPCVKRDWRKIMKDKLEVFARQHGEKQQYVSPNFSAEDVINKFGEKPICYLTGQEINIYQPRTYQFDHKIPRSRGGQNTLENLGICTKEANAAKHNKTPEEFIALCKKVLEHNGYNVQAVTTGNAPAST